MTRTIADIVSKRRERDQRPKPMHSDPVVQPNRREFHPLANIFPLPSQGDLDKLARDIREQGLLEPITEYQGTILDGRSRYLACDMAGVQPQFFEYAGTKPLDFVLGRNAHRRHLKGSQRAVVAARLSNLPLGANQYSDGLPIGRAAALLSVSQRTVARAKKILDAAAPELVQAIDRGAIKIGAAERIASLPQDEQRRIISEGLKPPDRKTIREEVASKPAATENKQLKAQLAQAHERLRQVEECLAATATANRSLKEIDANRTEDLVPDLDIPAMFIRLNEADERVLTALIDMITPAMDAATRAVQRRFIADLHIRFGIAD